MIDEHKVLEIEKKIFNDMPTYLQERYKRLSKEVNKSPYILRRYKKLGIITRVYFGVDSRTYQNLCLTLEITDGDWHVMNILGLEEIKGLLVDLGIIDIQDLVGTGMWLLSNGNMSFWLEPAKIKLHDKRE